MLIRKLPVAKAVWNCCARNKHKTKIEIGEMAMKILNFGSCNLDYVYSLEHIVMKGETESSAKMEIFAGGKGLNQSIAVARAGAKVY